MKRPIPPVNVAARERASALLAAAAPASDARVTVLGVLMRRPGAFVTYMELRAESQPLAAEVIDGALQWLVTQRLAERNDLPPWGLAYRALPEAESRGVALPPRADRTLATG